MRRTAPAGALALAALALAGCGTGSDAATVPVTTPAQFVEAVRQLVQPAERMGVVATASLDEEGPQPQAVEVDGLVDDVTREVKEFRALRPGDEALRMEQTRLLRAMDPVVSRVRAVRAILRSDSRAGLRDATTQLLDALREVPSTARS
ncbi:MAG: hypothetical protein KGQ95_05680 [Acidobacteria bacterium]|nr:hypothetical protein [Acidobacteriota bacterium]